MDSLRWLVGGSQSGGGGGPSDGYAEGVETVEKLVDRFGAAALYEDRRDALRALKALARKYRVEVGSIAMASLIEAMRDARHAPELASLALDAVCSVLGDANDEEADPVAGTGPDDELGERFAEIFIKDKAHVSLVITLLEESDFAIRRPAIHLLTSLLRHCQRQVQDIILEDPEAISKIMDLLMERREVLRNDAVLMLGEVTRGNANIQKLIAYENAFEVLFEVIANEAVDSIVIEDCMFVMLNLLKNNGSNQELFREQSLIKTLGSVLECALWPDEIEDDDDDNAPPSSKRKTQPAAGRPMGKWTNQRVANVVFMFQAIRCLVAPSNPAKLTAAAQKHIHDFGVLESLCATLMANDVTVPVLAEAICTVAEAMRGYSPSQNYFKTLKAPGGDKSAVSVLLISMASEKQPAELRYAVLYAFQSYLYRNEPGKSEIVATLLPSSNEQSVSATVGHYLCTMLVAHESLQVWLGAMCLLHCILDSPKLKEQLLRVQVATSLGSAPASLMSHAVSVLLRAGERRAAARAGVLCLLYEWLRDCPPAVARFLDSAENMNYVTERIVGATGGGEVSESDERVLKGLAAGLLGAAYLYIDDKIGSSYTRASLLQLVDRRISRDVICDCVDAVARSEPYVRAAQRPQPSPPASQREQSGRPVDPATGDCVQLDFEFARVWRKMEGQMTSAFRLLSPDANHADKSSIVSKSENVDHAAVPSVNGPTDGSESQVVQSYKELIKRQDVQMAELNAQIKRLQHELEEARRKEASGDELEKLRASLVEKCSLIERQNEALQQKAASTSVQAGVNADPETLAQLQKENSELRTQVENCVTTANAWQAEAARCQQIATQWQQYCLAQADAHDPSGGGGPKLCESTAVAALQQQLAELEGQLQFGYAAYEEQGGRLAAAEGSLAETRTMLAQEKQRSADLEMRLAQVQMDLDNQKQLVQIADSKNQHDLDKLKESVNQKETELTEIRKEQEDLLVLLADQDQKIKDYRKRLLALGQNVSDDESEADEQQDDADDEEENYGDDVHHHNERRESNEPKQNGLPQQHDTYAQQHEYNDSYPTHSETTYRYMTSQGQPVSVAPATVTGYGSHYESSDGQQQPNLQNYFGGAQQNVDQPNVF